MGALQHSPARSATLSAGGTGTSSPSTRRRCRTNCGCSTSPRSTASSTRSSGWPSAAPRSSASRARWASRSRPGRPNARAGTPPGSDAEVKRIADARPTAVNLRREVAAVGGGDPAGAPPRSRPRRSRSGTPTIAVSRQISERGAAYLIEERGDVPAQGAHALQHREPSPAWAGAPRSASSGHCTTGGALAHVIVDETRPLLQGARLTVLGARASSASSTTSRPTARRRS